jgi:hypothetical protein
VSIKDAAEGPFDVVMVPKVGVLLRLFWSGWKWDAETQLLTFYSMPP